MKKKILITGGCGFIGSHLTEFFLQKGFKVYAYDKYNSSNSWGWLEENNNKNLEVILGDVKDYNMTLSVIKNVDYIFHLSALISIPQSYISTSAFIENNVVGSFNVLEACKFYNKPVIITSTSEVYGTGRHFPMNENHCLNAQSPYAASKTSADQLALSYQKSFNLNLKIIRPFNAYGPRQSGRAIIPNLISQFINQEQKTINVGNINTSRDLTYVKDLCEAYYLLFKKKKTKEFIYNVGTNKDIKISDLIKLISKITSIKKKISIQKTRLRPKNSEVQRLLCDNSRFKKEFKWKPKTSITDGLDKTINWIEDNLHHFKTNNYNI
jgi:nucleoside-diphosphate-sugar epimerase